MDIRSFVPSLFPDGEFVDFADIRKGDTIIRGGYSVYGEPMNEMCSIMRAVKKLPEETENHLVSWITRDVSSGFMGDGIAAFKSPSDFDGEPWLYRVNLFPDTNLNEPTGFSWVTALTDAARTNGGLVEVTYDQLEPGQLVLVAPHVTLAPEVLQDEEDLYGYFTPDIYVGILGEKSKDGNHFLSSIEDSPFRMVSKKRFFPELYLAQF
jgi:hypothetical protein